MIGANNISFKGEDILTNQLVAKGEFHIFLNNFFTTPK